MLEQAFFPTLKTLANAPDSSPLQAITPYHVAEFIIGLTSSRNHKPGSESYSVHNNLALSILAEALDPNSELDEQTLLKSLKYLDIRFEDNVLKDNAREAADKIIEAVSLEIIFSIIILSMTPRHFLSTIINELWSVQMDESNKRLVKYVQQFKAKFDNPNEETQRNQDLTQQNQDQTQRNQDQTQQNQDPTQRNQNQTQQSPEDSIDDEDSE